MPGMKKAMDEFKKRTLHSGSKQGPVVTNRKQAIAIGLSEASRAVESIPPRPVAKKSTPTKAAHPRKAGDLIRRALGGK